MSPFKLHGLPIRGSESLQENMIIILVLLAKRHVGLENTVFLYPPPAPSLTMVFGNVIVSPPSQKVAPPPPPPPFRTAVLGRSCSDSSLTIISWYHSLLCSSPGELSTTSLLRSLLLLPDPSLLFCLSLFHVVVPLAFTLLLLPLSLLPFAPPS